MVSAGHAGPCGGVFGPCSDDEYPEQLQIIQNVEKCGEEYEIIVVDTEKPEIVLKKY